MSPDLSIIVEKFNPLYEIAFEFLMCVAEPISRSELIHEYVYILFLIKIDLDEYVYSHGAIVFSR